MASLRTGQGAYGLFPSFPMIVASPVIAYGNGGAKCICIVCACGEVGRICLATLAFVFGLFWLNGFAMFNHLTL